MKSTQKLRGALRAGSPVRRRRGSTLIEFALVVPILIVMLLGIIEFGWLVKNHLTVANATREGARIASLGKTTGVIYDRIENSAKPVVVNRSTNITLTKTTTAGTTSALGDDNSVNPPENNAQPGDLIKVTVNVPHTSLTNLPFMSGKTIEVSVSMVRER